MRKKGILLVNLGTPASPEPWAVGEYLREFLMDPFVIDVPWILRWPLIHFLITPFRSQSSSEKYTKVWTSQGSPLLKNMRDLQSSLKAELGESFVVEMGMRYGEPRLESAFQKLEEEDIEDLYILPLYPQYAESSTLSSIKKIESFIRTKKIRILRDFYNQPEFIDSFAALIQEERTKFQPDFLLFSYHGLPERHISKVEPGCQPCLRTLDCHLKDLSLRPLCYRGQCFATTEALVSRLQVPQEKYQVSFQSRLGKRPWIQPFTDLELPRLVAKGHRRVLVACPAFTADCLETLEEIQIQAREDFVRLGGEDLKLVPSLNAHPIWVRNLAQLINRWISNEGSLSAHLWLGS